MRINRREKSHVWRWENDSETFGGSIPSAGIREGLSFHSLFQGQCPGIPVLESADIRN